MKLRTEMAKWSDGNMYPSVHGEREVYGMLEHDAACAHALMQAMSEAGDGSANVAFYSDGDYQTWVYDRADSILREWGFDSGEVAE